MGKEKATHILVIFEPPGPVDNDAELKALLPFVTKNNNFSLAGNCKIEAWTEPMGNVTDYTFLQTMMFQWLRDEGEDVKKFSIGSVGINRHDSRYEFFQIAWAVPEKRGWQFWK